MLSRIEEIAARRTFLDFEISVSREGRLDGAFEHWPSPLSELAIQQLEAQGCTAADWSKVRVASGTDLKTIQNVRFAGHCLVGRLQGPAFELLPGLPGIRPGLQNVAMTDCLIGDGCAVRDVSQMIRVDMQQNSLAIDCGLIGGGELNALGLDRRIKLGPEAGGREVPVMPGLGYKEFAWMAAQAGDRTVMERVREICAGFRRNHRRVTTLIGEGVQLRGVGRVLRSALGPGTRCVDAHAVEDTITMSTPDQPVEIGTGTILRGVTLEPGVRVVDGAFCENAHFCEESHAGQHAKVTDSVIAPNSGVECGECRSSLLGPFTGFHHQSLLISAFWPNGKGTVGYGANLGSNHTGRMPDQELWVGEGVFFGLGCSVKFPANLVDAPYSIVASGVVTLPQDIRFPFSLVNQPGDSSPGLSPAFNELVPGWMIDNNMFGLLRSESKFRSRNRARGEAVNTRLFRPEFIPLLLDSRDRLESVRDYAGKLAGGARFATAHELPGCGKNYVTEKSIHRGIEAYTFAVRLILSKETARLWAEQDPDLDAPFDITELRALGKPVLGRVRSEFLAKGTWREAIRFAVPNLEEALLSARQARDVDHARGIRIIPDYEAITDNRGPEHLLDAYESELDALRESLD